MGLEVSYKVFLDDDAGFLEPIHPLPDTEMDVADQVRNVEEGIFYNHLVGNIPEMNPHVMEAGYQFIEVVVDNVCGHVLVPFGGVGDDGVDIDLEAK